jgi:hypothetical protein
MMGATMPKTGASAGASVGANDVTIGDAAANVSVGASDFAIGLREGLKVASTGLAALVAGGTTVVTVGKVGLSCGVETPVMVESTCRVIPAGV